MRHMMRDDNVQQLQPQQLLHLPGHLQLPRCLHPLRPRLLQNLCISQWYSTTRGRARGQCPQCRTSILSIQTLCRHILARILNFFHQQWFSLTRSVHDLAVEVPTSVREMATSSICSICLDPFNSPAACIPCGHVFCNLCISQWYSTTRGGARGQCPQCRTSILSIHDGHILARILNFFHQQWFSLTRSVHDLAVEVLTSVRATVLLSWFNLGPEVQVFTLLMLFLLASLLIIDLHNPVGLFNCVFPMGSLCQEVFRETLCCLLLLIGQCILQRLLVFWDIFSHIFFEDVYWDYTPCVHHEEVF